jgi:hypothetical protein
VYSLFFLINNGQCQNEGKKDYENFTLRLCQINVNCNRHIIKKSNEINDNGNTLLNLKMQNQNYLHFEIENFSVANVIEIPYLMFLSK